MKGIYSRYEYHVDDCRRCHGLERGTKEELAEEDCEEGMTEIDCAYRRNCRSRRRNERPRGGTGLL